MISEILIWVLVWVVGSAICLYGYYYNYNKIALSHLIYSVTLWWIIIPFFTIIAITGAIIALLDKMDNIILFKK